MTPEKSATVGTSVPVPRGLLAFDRSRLPGDLLAGIKDYEFSRAITCDLRDGGCHDVRRAIANPHLIRAKDFAEGIRVLDLTDEGRENE